MEQINENYMNKEDYISTHTVPVCNYSEIEYLWLDLPLSNKKNPISLQRKSILTAIGLVVHIESICIHDTIMIININYCMRPKCVYINNYLKWKTINK